LCGNPKYYTVLDPSGKLMLESVIETNAITVVQFIRGLRGELHVTLEEETGRRRYTIC
jgi:hypothetical protein